MTEHGTPPAEDVRNGRKLRVARLIILASISFLLVALLVFPLMEVTMAGEGFSPWRSLAAAGISVPLGVTLVLLLRSRLDGRRDPDPRLYWGSVALTVVGAAALQHPFLSMSFLAAWWGVGVFVAPRRRGAVVTLGLLAVPWLLIPLSPLDIHFLAYLAVWLFAIAWALVLAAGSLASLWLWDVTNDAVRGQAARAQLAVTEERLRFARDMHDLLGHSLSALAVKAELAGRLAERAPERAAAEMTEVHELARKALQQVRTAVSGYREVDLAGEVDAVGSVLAANGTRVSVTGLDGLALSPERASLAAWVVREGVTNVLRHSDATECQIVFTPTRDTAVGRVLVVEVSNDRARGDGAMEGSSGNGLAGLSERVSMSGGTLSAAHTGNGGFLLRAVIPL
ncbi:two-component system sensor histidine kinase DesK [Nocardiopsis arvandica]|uniref:Two-component system sensor histidine kinase DesK n=1 Tax=Nocardiopsis sinuspersici TaxID=501010 RepID=A0A7Y9XCI2_9ACTN|nr:histidine kinase [Nocardiopsis sinuspersici]NYH52377.1 two-component system sensor histidine kinase DesK [Nocardiopsis sinuspersici]